ncbi:MAG: hypothetical protein WC058_02740 [Phycisphaeraceae bacterium]
MPKALASETGVTQRHSLKFIREHNARRAVQRGAEEESPATEPGRVPRVTRLMALALRFEHLLECGLVHDQAELAELGHVTRPRVTQIMNLLHLAPDIQEAILDLPRIASGRTPITERDVRPIAAEPNWNIQRKLWQRMQSPGQ